MPHPIVPFTSDDALPASADVVVIGAGIIGVTAALELARADLSVAVIEKGRVAAEQSSRNWGWVRQQGRDRREIPLDRREPRHLGPPAGTGQGRPRHRPRLSAYRPYTASPAPRPSSTAGGAGRCAAGPPASRWWTSPLPTPTPRCPAAARRGSAASTPRPTAAPSPLSQCRPSPSWRARPAPPSTSSPLRAAWRPRAAPSPPW